MRPNAQSDLNLRWAQMLKVLFPILRLIYGGTHGQPEHPYSRLTSLLLLSVDIKILILSEKS